MSTSEQANDAPEEPRTSGVYVYGIAPADVETDEDAVGVCDGSVSIVTRGDIAALVSEISVDRPRRLCSGVARVTRLVGFA